METCHDLRRSDPPRHDLRREDRRTCDDNISVTWRDSGGENKFARVKALDICEFGLRLQMPEALPRQAYVALSASKLGLVGQASVRHCTRLRGAKFAIGVEFTAGLHWMPRG